MLLPWSPFLTLLIAACGGGAPSEPSTPTTQPAGDAGAPRPAGGAADGAQGGFVWDVERYPVLAGIELGEDGLPKDPNLRPGPDGLPDALKALLEGGGFSAGRSWQAGPGASPLYDGTQPDPPTSLQCVGDEPPHGCFTRIDGVTFLMGAQASDPTRPNYDPDAMDNEGPPHPVAVEPFWIMKYEMDASTVLRCLRAGFCTVSDPDALEGFVDESRLGDPARNLTFVEAARVCAYLGARLPTEAEWELAARGIDHRRWPWGDFEACGVNWPNGSPKANKEALGDIGGALMTPPCHLLAPGTVGQGAGHSPFGMLAMGGNVAEWTADLFAPYTPTGTATPADGENRRVVRGGSFLAEPIDLRTTARQPSREDLRMPDVGLRCAWGGGDAQ